MTEPKLAAARRLPSGRPVRPAVVRSIDRQVSKYDEAIREFSKLEEDVEELKASSKSPGLRPVKEK